MTFEELNKLIEATLGISLNEADRSSIPDLNSLPPRLIENARKLDMYPGMCYLEFYVQPEDKKYVRAFYQQVVLENQEDASTWRKGRVLIPSVSLEDQLTKEKETLLGAYVSKISVIAQPDIASWFRGVSSGGGFVFPEPAADYRTPVPPGFFSSEEIDIVPIDTLKTGIFFRRWIASRMAMCVEGIDQLDRDQIIRALERTASKRKWTNDAHKALAGLIEEQKHRLWTKDQVPGFCGPDTYYE